MQLPFEKREYKELIRQEAETDPKYGKKPEERDIEELLEKGVINIDKPSGPSSHQISAYVQKILQKKKAGHSGTLDPKVTGCLPIAVDKATRVVQSLLTAGKEYICVMHLHEEKSREEILQVFKEFTGRIKQLPPVKSAVKRQWRFRKVYYIELLDINGQDVLFRTGTEAGTYIRKLVHDIGQKLGCGAHMAELRRSKAGPFNEDSLVTLQELTDAYHYYKNGDDSSLKKVIQPMENAIAHLPKIYVQDTAVDTLCHGMQLKVPGIIKVDSDIQEDNNVAVLTLKGELVLVGTSTMKAKALKSLCNQILIQKLILKHAQTLKPYQALQGFF